jgi:diguanylate cyclase (GGDEF)-like protein
MAANAAVAITAVLVAMLSYAAVNFGVLFVAIYLAVRPEKLRQLLENWQDVTLEFATLCLGGLTALALVNQPLLSALVVPPLFVLQRSVLTKQLEIAATTDAKTGLLNAATWQHMAHRELARASREHEPAALLIIDMDNFNLVNDNPGHIAGDAVLKAVGNCLAEELRQYDAIGRFGGEEFVALLSGVDELLAVGISERIRQRIETLEVATGIGDQPPLIGLSASIGISCYQEHGEELEELLHAADSALYAAKRAGRNRVVVSAS